MRETETYGLWFISILFKIIGYNKRTIDSYIFFFLLVCAPEITNFAHQQNCVGVRAFFEFFFYHYYYYYYYEYDFVFFPLCCCYKRKNLFFLGVVDFHNVKCRHESDFGKRNQLNGFICFALINIRNKMKLKQRTSIYVSQIGLVEPNLWIA